VPTVVKRATLEDVQHPDVGAADALAEPGPQLCSRGPGAREDHGLAQSGQEAAQLVTDPLYLGRAGGTDHLAGQRPVGGSRVSRCAERPEAANHLAAEFMERTLGWIMKRFRRVRDYERLPDHHKLAR
jgi:hypothetical protein